MYCRTLEWSQTNLREVHQDPGRPTRPLPGQTTVPHTGRLECMAL